MKYYKDKDGDLWKKINSTLWLWDGIDKCWKKCMEYRHAYRLKEITKAEAFIEIL